MVRNRKKEKVKGNFDAETMKEGVRLVLEGGKIRPTAMRLGLKFQTLAMYVKKFRENPDGEHEMKLSNSTRQVFTEEQEHDLETFLITSSKMFYGLSNIDTRKLAYEMAEVNKIVCPEQWITNKMAGKDWLYGFMKRHPNLSLRAAEGCSLARAISFNKHNVNVFFDNYEQLIKKYPELRDPTRIWNLDETKTETNQRPSRVIAQKGIKQVATAVSNEKGTLVTTVLIINAAGNSMPPAMVFPRVHFKTHMINGAPAGTLGLAHQSGWMTTSNFVHVMQHFITFSGSSVNRKMLLICDNHESHLSIAAIELARANGVIILTVPPHCTHMMQPLDVGVMKPFKTFYNAAVDSRLSSNPGQTFGIYDVASCVGIAHGRALMPQTIINAFQKTGIFPVDRYVFTEDMYLPSLVSDKPAPLHNEETIEPVQSGSQIQEPLTSQSPGTSQSSTTPQTLETRPSAIYQCPVAESNQLVKTSTQKNQSPHYKSPVQFKGYPKSTPKDSSRKPREKGRSRIITDTPEKLLIEQKQEQKEKKVKKVRSKPLVECNVKKRKLVFELEEENQGDLTEQDKPEPIQEFDKNKLDIGDFVLVKFTSDKQRIHYVGKIIKKCEDTDLEISFLRKSCKMENKFFYPNVEDLSSVSLDDIVALLPSPSEQGTKRQKSMLTFYVSLKNYNIR